MIKALRNKTFISLSIGVILILLGTNISCNKTKENPKVNTATKIASIHADLDGYVGSETCISCHEAEFKGWQNSHHFKAMMEANDSTVLGDFSDVKVTLDKVVYRFYKEENVFKVDVTEKSGTKTYIIDYTFGFTPLQQYLIAFPKGKYQTLRASWDSEKNQWFHQYEETELSENDWLHWTQGGQNWNTMCSSCHSTNLKRNYFLETDSFATSWSELTVGCEACHGPAKAHLQWSNSENPTGNPRIVTLKEDSKKMIETCAPCHARRTALTETFKPNESFEDLFRLQTIDNAYYHADGQIKEEDYVYGSFLQSEMYHQGVKCTDCHNAHSYQLKLEGNALCNQCHAPEYDSEKHHFHPIGSESAQCVNCHMTGANFMVNDFRRDHSFRVPRPDQSVKYNTPNACTGCHTEKSDQWAANKVIAWYGDKRKTHFSDLLLPGSKMDKKGNRKLLELIRGEYPNIAKTTAMYYLSRNVDFGELQSVWASIENQSSSFKYEFLMAFLNTSQKDRKIALGYLNHEKRIVRIGAAMLLVDLDPNTLDASMKNAWYVAQSELENYLKINADFPAGRLNLGDYYLRRGVLDKAQIEYRMAQRKDSLLIDPYYKLASIYSSYKLYSQAERQLKLCLKHYPEQSRTYYLLGLLKFETEKKDEGIVLLKKAIELDENNYKALYNLAVLYYEMKNFKDALFYTNKALEATPNAEDALYLKYILFVENEEHIKAKQMLIKLNHLYPGNKMYSDLLSANRY